MAFSSPAEKRQAKPPAFFLAGDSTTAVNGGWGNGFISQLKAPAWGVNIGKSGATTRSYEAGGYWANITSHLRQYSFEYDSYVTISFGHNDQRPENGVTYAQYQANLIRFANEVKSLGGTPLLTSSLTRRVFSNGSAEADDSLRNERLAAVAAAQQTNSTLIDLYAASRTYVNAIGNAPAQRYNLASGDRTHLNPWGEKVFGRLVIDLLLKQKPALSQWFVANATLSGQLTNGIPA